MRSPELIQKNMDLFAYIFLLSQRLQYISDKILEQDSITTKQFLMMAVIEKAFDHPPGLKEVAEVLGTTHQNVKQMAKQLEKKGFIELFKDPEDRRVTRLRTTDYCREFWDSRTERQTREVLEMFRDFSDEEIDVMHKQVTKLYSSLEPMYRELRNQ